MFSIMSNLYKNLFWGVFSLFVVAAVFSLFVESGSVIKPYSIDQLVAKINAGQIAKIDVNGNYINIELKDGTKARARKESETGLSQTFKNFGLDDRLLRDINFSVEEESGTKFWLGILIPT